MNRRLAVFLLILAGIILAALPAAAQENPNAPSAVTASAVGDAEVTVSWTTPSTGEACPDITDYFVRIWDPAARRAVVELFTESRSHTVGGLNPGTKYVAYVWTYSAECDDYSLSPATITFTTTDAASEADPNPDSTPLLAPRAPTNVQVTVSNNTAAISWTAPVDDATHCDVDDYSVSVQDRTDRSIEDKVADYILTTSTTISGLTAGRQYRVLVYGYSVECDDWSAEGKATFQN